MKTHGMTKTPTFKSWQSMHQRCGNPNAPNYHRYGGRGISVCLRWSSFEAFVADMGIRPKGKTLGRKNNSESYSPGNCRWEGVYQQQRNRRNVFMTPRKVREIRSRASDGATGVSLAREYGCSTGLVSMILSGKRWPDGEGQ